MKKENKNLKVNMRNAAVWCTMFDIMYMILFDISV